MSKAVIFFAPGLEECEGLLCVDILRRAGVEVTIAAVGGEKIVKSARQISVVADALAEELDYTVFDACILPGGIPGVPNLKADATVRRVCRDFAAEGKVVAAICAAPTALAAFGVLNGKKATVYPGMDADLTAAGASYTGLPLTIDGSIVTGEALGAAIPFALALARILAGADAEDAKSLSPILKVADLYLSAGMLDDLPLQLPIREARRISSPYGYRKDPFTGQRKYHSGIDYACDLATTVHATAGGTITFVGNRGGYGKCVEINHRYGFSTIYAHLSGYYVGEGAYVPAGKVIGFVGSTGRSTGCHLHYEVRKNGRIVKPLFIN